MTESQAQEMTFAMMVTPNADGAFSRSVMTTVRYVDRSPALPHVPFVFSVPEPLSPEPDFAAEAN